MKKKSIVLLLFTMLMSMNVMAQMTKKANSVPAKQVRVQTQKKKVAAKLSLLDGAYLLWVSPSGQ